MDRTSDPLEAFWKTFAKPASPLGGRRRGFRNYGVVPSYWPLAKAREATPPGKLDGLPNRWERLRVAGNGRFKPQTRKPDAELHF